MTKTCSMCNIEKPLDEFNLDNSNTRDGRQCWCRECQNNYNKRLNASKNGSTKKNKKSANRTIGQLKRRIKELTEKLAQTPDAPLSDKMPFVPYCPQCGCHLTPIITTLAEVMKENRHGTN